MTKGQLSKYYYLSLEIKEIEEKIQSIRETSVGSTKLTRMPTSHNNESPLEKRVELLITLSEKLEHRKNKAIEEMTKVEQFLSTIVDSETRLIFNKRYIEFKRWDKIAQELHMSESSVFRRHKKQLSEAGNV